MLNDTAISHSNEKLNELNLKATTNLETEGGFPALDRRLEPMWIAQFSTLYTCREVAACKHYILMAKEVD